MLRLLLLTTLCVSVTLSATLQKGQHKTGEDRVLHKSDDLGAINLDDPSQFSTAAEIEGDDDVTQAGGEQQKAPMIEDLSLAELRHRIHLLFDKIDGKGEADESDQDDGNQEDKSNRGDGYLTVRELRRWLEHLRERNLEMNLQQQWGMMGMGGKHGKLAWEVYINKHYGDGNNEQDEYSIGRDKLTWSAADRDKDGELDHGEFLAFSSPESAEYMHSFLVKQLLDDLDTNEDGQVTEQEFVESQTPDSESRTSLPWQNEAVDQFRQFDLNKNRVLDLSEAETHHAELLSATHNHAAIANNIMDACDKDKDGRLSKEEVWEKRQDFTDSQITDWGDAILYHDEF